MFFTRTTHVVVGDGRLGCKIIMNARVERVITIITCGE